MATAEPRRDPRRARALRAVKDAVIIASDRRPAGALDLDRLARVLGLLGSSHDGEVLAAARMAERMRREAGATWSQILAPTPAEPGAPPHPASEFDSAADACDFVLEIHPDLTDWEAGFCWSLRRRRRPRTAKQAAVLGRLVAEASRERRGFR
jgi:hypothetical protein